MFILQLFLKEGNEVLLPQWKTLFKIISAFFKNQHFFFACSPAVWKECFTRMWHIQDQMTTKYKTDQ